MFLSPELREDARRYWSHSFQFSVIIPKFKMVEKIPGIAVSVDVSRGGIGLVTETPVEAGQVIIFENELKMHEISAKIAIVKWIDRSTDNQYRVGLQFV